MTRFRTDNLTQLLNEDNNQSQEDNSAREIALKNAHSGTFDTKL